jgi:hypothetical protein
MSLFRRKHARARTGPVSVSAAAIAEGWHGLAWGAPLSAFRATFPQALRTENDWWHTGEGPEPFCGVPMAITQYGFNTRDQLSTVTFIPDTKDRPQLSVAAVNELGPPEGMDLLWTFGDVVVEIKLAGVMATMTHPAYINR